MSFHSNLIPRRFGAGARQETTFCPDCERKIQTAEFVAHREREHPPQTITVSGVGSIKSETRFGWESDNLSDPALD